LLAERLRELRETRGYTQAELAKRARISSAYICRIEGGDRTNVGSKTVVKLARALGTSVDYLLGRPESGKESLDPDVAYIAQCLARLPERLRKRAVRNIIDMLNILQERG